MSVSSRDNPYYSKKIWDFCQEIQGEVKEKKGWRLEDRGEQ